MFGHDVVKLLEEDLAISLAFTIVVEEELPFFLGTHPLYIYPPLYIYMYVRRVLKATPGRRGWSLLFPTSTM